MPELGMGDCALVVVVAIVAIVGILPIVYSIALGSIAVIWGLWYLWQDKTYWQRRGVPSPKANIFVGNTFKIRREGHEYDQNNFDRLGPTYGDYNLGRKEVISMDLDIVRSVMVKEFDCFADFVIAFHSDPEERKDSLPMNQLLFTSGEQWKRVRNQITPAFTSGKMKKLVPILEQCMTGLGMHIDKHITEGMEIDVTEAMGWVSMDLIAQGLFGINIHVFENEKNSTFVKQCFDFFERFQLMLINLIAFPYTIEMARKYLGVDLVANAPMKYFRDLLERLYDDRKADPDAREKHHDLFQIMLNVVDDADAEGSQADSKRLTKVEMMSNCVAFMAAAYETTGVLLRFALYHIASMPDVQDRIYEEIQRVIGNSEHITYDHITNMPYLMQVIYETLRICPPSLRTGRQCTAPVTLKGVPFEVGNLFMVPIYAIHHHPDFYTEPEKFDPDRFSTENKARRDPLTFLPFGYGPRHCAGMRMAEFEALITLAFLCRHYRFRPGKNSPNLPLEVVSLGGGLRLNPKKPLFVVAEKR